MNCIASQVRPCMTLGAQDEMMYLAALSSFGR